MKILGAVSHFLPRYCRQGDRGPPRSWRALQGWRKRCPGRSRTPEPLGIWCAMSNALTRDAHLSAVLAKRESTIFRRFSTISLAELDRTSHESPCPTTRQISLAFWVPSNVQESTPEPRVAGGPPSMPTLRSLTKFRSPAEVKRRGGWKQDKNVARHEKGSRFGFSAQQHSATLTLHGDESEKRHEDILLHGRTIAPPVGLGRVQLRRGAMSQM